MPEGHTRFAIFNRTLNPFMSGVLRTPAHRLFSKSLMLITVTGRRSGKEHTFPVAYRQEADRVLVDVGWPERKQWWRNLRQSAPVKLRLQGVERSGRAVANGEPPSVTVEIALDPA